MYFKVNKVKIVVTVPVNDLENIRRAVCEAGAGIIGEYTYCTFSSRVTGTFMPNEKAHPYIGEVKKLEYVDEEKLEFICEVDKVKKVIEQLRAKHPYEEPGIDIIPLIDENEFY